MCRIPFLHILTVVMYDFSHFCQTDEDEKVSHCFNLHFWIPDEVDHPVMFMVITVFHYECVLISFVHLALLGYLGFLTDSLYTLAITPVLVICDATAFFQYIVCL